MSLIYSTIDLSALVRSTKKGDVRKLQIVDKAINLIFESGIEGFSFETLSKRSKVSRPLLYHYFPDLNDLYLFMATLIRYRYQNHVIEEMKNKILIQDVLRAYIGGALGWFDTSPKEACVWLIYFVQCSRSPEIAAQNQSLVEMGRQRIEQLLSVGLMKGEFRLPPDRVAVIARRIQVLITGQLVSRATEKRSAEAWQLEFKEAIEFSLGLVL